MPVLAELFRASVQRFGSNVAVVDPHESISLTYDELDSLVNYVASVLHDVGLRQGDHVAICARNSAYWVACEGALAKCGLVAVPINIYLSPAEVVWQLEHSEARAIFFDGDQESTVERALDAVKVCETAVWLPTVGAQPPEWAEALPSADEAIHSRSPDPAAQVRPSQPHRIMYTSATTGVPKGVVCSNEIIVGAVVTALANQLHDLRAEDRLLVTTPLTHVANGFFWPFFASGCTSVLMRRYDPATFCDLIAAKNISHSVMAPTLLADLANYLDADPTAHDAVRGSGLRSIWYAGSPIPAVLSERVEALLGPILNQQYGLTEMLSGFPAIGITQLFAESHAAKRESCGRPVQGAVIKIFDEEGSEVAPGKVGEVAIMMHSAQGGYWRLNSENQQAFRGDWLFTDDIGWFDDEGFLYLRDRRTDMIISGGLNVYPTEVENTLLAHPAIANCAVVGVADDRWIEVPHAVVVARTGRTIDRADVIAFCRERIAHYKCPKDVHVADDLPVSATGKILRRVVRAQLADLYAVKRADFDASEQANDEGGEESRNVE